MKQTQALTFKNPGTVMVRRIFLKAPGSVPSSPSASVTCSSMVLTFAATIFTKACGKTQKWLFNNSVKNSEP